MIRVSIAGDVSDLAPRLREEDKREIEVLTGLSPLEALSVGLFQSDVCITAVKGGKVIAMAGVAPVNKRTGSVWLLTSPEIVDHKRELVVFGRKWLDEQHKLHRDLSNYVTASNELHIRLIRHLGFTFGEPFVLPGSGEKIIPFIRRS